MTTEIAILNTQAVALAADSAATVDQVGKVYPSANKIFGLSKIHPVAVMIWNSGAFLGVPWETIVKLYREHLGSRSFPTLPEYLADFVAFLTSDPRVASRSSRDAYTAILVASHMREASSRLRAEAEERLRTNPATPISAAELESIATRVFSEIKDRIMGFDPIDPTWTAADFRKPLEKNLDAALTEAFGVLPIGGAAALVKDFTSEAIVRRVETSEFSGVVVAGFGDDDVFPSLVEREVDGMAGDRVRCWERGSHFVASEGPGIVPFAQRDMVEAFIEGVSPTYQQAIETMVRRVVEEYPTALMDAVPSVPAKVRSAIDGAHKALGQKYLGNALKQLEDWRNATFVQELLSVVASLPKESLADLAEALVSLTSLRRRMSRGLETVGGPIDVAVISKGDGLIWMKRKHYFDPRLNPQYMSNRFGRP